MFYHRDEDGNSTRAGLRSDAREHGGALGPLFFRQPRGVREYTEAHYLPAASAYRSRAGDGGKFGAELLHWQREIAARWDHLRFGAMNVRQHGAEYEFDVQV